MLHEVIRDLPDESVAVAHPDHPFLLEPPDVLVGDSGRLTAYFIVGDEERLGAGRHTLARYLLCRLALPAHALVVVVVGDARGREEEWTAVADAVRPPTHGRRDLPSEPMSSPWYNSLLLIRGAHYERFAETWTTASARPSVRQRPGESTASLTWRTDQGRLTRRRSRFLDYTDGHLVLHTPEDISRRALRQVIASATSTTAQFDFGLTEAVSGLVRTALMIHGGDAHLATHRARLGGRSEGAFDPLRTLRSAAFAGFQPDNSP